MFDIGFSELLLIGVVALVVIGPEKLPRVARTMGHLFGRLQRYVAQVKTDINREVDLAELNRVKTEFEGAARSFQSDLETKASEAEREIREVQASIDRELQPAAPAAEPPPAAPAAAAQLELGIEEPETPAAAARERAPG